MTIRKETRNIDFLKSKKNISDFVSLIQVLSKAKTRNLFFFIIFKLTKRLWVVRR